MNPDTFGLYYVFGAVILVMAAILLSKKRSKKPQQRHMKIVGHTKEAAKLRRAVEVMKRKAPDEWKFAVEPNLSVVKAERRPDGTYGVSVETGEVMCPPEHVHVESLAMICAALRHEAQHVINYEEDKAAGGHRKNSTDENQALMAGLPVLISCGGSPEEIRYWKSLNYKDHPWDNR